MMKLEKGLMPLRDGILVDESVTTATLSVNRAVKTDAVMVCDKPREGNMIDCFCIVTESEDLEHRGETVVPDITISDGEIFALKGVSNP